jgi:polar amino acid transport system substrate-binding protein
MDVQLSTLYTSKLGLNIDIQQVAWKDHLEDVKEGRRDIAAGAAENDERKNWAYYSIPYRSEEDVVVLLKSRSMELPFSTVPELITLMREKRLKMAVVDGYNYATKEFMEFINDPKNADMIVRSKTDPENLEMVVQGKADFYIVDRMVGATIAWRMKKLDVLEERRMSMTYPLYFLFSKKTVPYELVERFNDVIRMTKASGEHAKIVRDYLFPVLLMQTLDSNWFFILEFIGIVAFAISGLVIAFEERANFFGTLVMTALPSIGGGIMRDLVANRAPLSIVKSPSYVFIVIMVVLLAFFFLNVRRVFFPTWTLRGSKEKLQRMGTHIIQVCDAIGLGAFTVVGVTVAIIVKAQPLIFWGPILAALTGVGGSFARDMLRKHEKRNCLTGELYAEIALFWGFIFALIMQNETERMDIDRILWAVAIAAVGASVTRMIAYFFKIPGIPFVMEEKKGMVGSK